MIGRQSVIRTLYTFALYPFLNFCMFQTVFFTTMNTAWICRLSGRLPRKLKEGKLISALIGKRPFFFLIERQHMPVMDADRDIVLPLLSVHLSVHCRYCVKKNGHIVTLFDLQAGASFYFF